MSEEQLTKIKNARYFFHDDPDSDLYKDWQWLIEQAKRVQKLEEENERLCALNIATTHELNHVDKINKRYREALEFYADEETYEPFEVQIGAVTKEGYKTSKNKYDPIINTDKGKKARQALESEK